MEKLTQKEESRDRRPLNMREFWSNVLKDTFSRLLVIAVIASLTGLLGYFYGRFDERRLYEKRYESAVELYLSGLDRTIREAARSRGPTMIAKAKAVVNLRDQLRAAPLGIAKGLNDEFDKLSEILVAYEEQQSHEEDWRDGLEPSSMELESRINQRLLYLEETWPWKRQGVETGLRQVISYLGFDELADSKRPGR